jgi:hypothetical protein
MGCRLPRSTGKTSHVEQSSTWPQSRQLCRGLVRDPSQAGLSTAAGRDNADCQRRSALSVPRRALSHRKQLPRTARFHRFGTCGRQGLGAFPAPHPGNVTGDYGRGQRRGSTRVPVLGRRWRIYAGGSAGLPEKSFGAHYRPDFRPATPENRAARSVTEKLRSGSHSSCRRLAYSPLRNPRFSCRSGRAPSVR